MDFEFVKITTLVVPIYECQRVICSLNSLTPPIIEI